MSDVLFDFCATNTRIGCLPRYVSFGFVNDNPRPLTAQEIILHTLFESGTTRVQDLERYVTDDIVRHGTRMSELEKRLETALAEAVSIPASIYENVISIESKLPDR
jgi:hypothetical protein